MKTVAVKLWRWFGLLNSGFWKSNQTKGEM
jgi:hypothetical protein